MKRKTKILLGGIGAIVILLVVALVIVATYDWNRAKPWLTETVGKAIGRKITIDGNLSVRWQRDPDLRSWHAWIPGPRISLANVTIGNSEWAKAPNFGSLTAVDIDLSLLPLLAHRISIPSVRLVSPSASFERLADGRNNWSFAAALPADATAASPWQFDLGRVQFDQGDFAISDRQNGLDAKVKVTALQKSIPFDELVAQQQASSQQDAAARVGAKGAQSLDKRSQKNQPPKPEPGKPEASSAPQHYAFGLTFEGTLQGKAVHGTGKIGGVLALKNADRPFPLHADVRIGATRVAFVGTLVDPTDLDALDLRLWLSGNNLSDLYDILKVTLPDSPPYATEGHLTGSFNKDDRKLRYEDFTARVGGSDLAGNLLYETKKPRPLLSGKVESDLLQFRDLAPIIGVNVDKTDAKQADAPVQPGNKVLPVEPFRPQRWQVMDADVQFTGDRVFRDSELPIHKVDTRIIMDNAMLSLDPLKFRLAYGDVVASVRMDGRTTPIKATLKLTASGMQLARMLPQAEALKTSLGQANADAALTATGNSVGTLLGAANGEVKLIVDRGTISKGLVETIGLNVPNILINKLFGDQQIQINCAAADFAANSGVFDSKLFLIDTDIATINITGKVNLASEQMDLTLSPDSKGLRLLSLRSPIHVQGTFKQPDVNIDKGILLARGAGALVLGVFAAPAAALLPLTATSFGNNDDNRCAPLLEQMQKSVAKPAVKSPAKPAPH